MKAESHLLESLNLISQQRMILCLFQSPTDSLSIQPGAALSCPLDLVTEKALYFHYAAIHSALTKRAKRRPFTQSILQNITALFNYSFQRVDRQGKRGIFATGFTFFFYPHTPPPLLYERRSLDCKSIAHTEKSLTPHSNSIVHKRRANICNHTDLTVCTPNITF